jgi:hypothetical protein
VIVKPQTRFYVRSLGSALLGGLFGLGGVVAQNTKEQSRGEALLERFGIPDPALRVRERFTANLASSESRQVVLEPGIHEDDKQVLQEEFGEGWVLDFRTRVWGMAGRNVELWMRGRVVRLSDGKQVWSETCKYMNKEPKAECPRDEDMLADGAARLKANMEESAEHCAAELWQRFGGSAPSRPVGNDAPVAPGAPMPQR